MSRLPPLLLSTLLCSLLLPLTIHAQSLSCSASVSPNSLQPSETTTFAFTITNDTDDYSYNSLQIVSPPSADLTIQSASHSNWSVSNSSNTVSLSGYQLSPRESMTLYVTASSNGTQGSGSWSVSATSTTGDSTSCSGSLNTSVAIQPTSPPGATPTPIIVTNTITSTVTAADTKAPVITLNPLSQTTFATVPVISGSAVDDTQVARLDYSFNNTTWFPVTITPAPKVVFSFTPANPPPTFKVYLRTRDNAGNTTTSSTPDYSFDRAGPKVTFSTAFDKPFTSKPQISGTVSDSSKVASLSFSYNNGRDWLPVTIDSSQTKTPFSLTLPVTVSGTFRFKMKAVDGIGNQSETDTKVVQVDRLAPQPSSFYLDFNGLPLTPSGGTYTVPAATLLTLHLSIAGNPQTAELHLHDTLIPLTKEPFGHLWRATFTSPNTPNNHDLFLVTTDRGGSINHLLGQLVTTRRASIQPNKLDFPIMVFAQDPSTGSFAPWTASNYHQANPLPITPEGNFTLFLTPGTYYLTFGAHRLFPRTSSVFHITANQFITDTFSLGDIDSFWFRATHWLSSLPVTASKSDTLSPLLNTPLPDITLPAGNSPIDRTFFRGKTTLLAILPSWLPETPNQLHQLDSLKLTAAQQVLALSPQDTPEDITSFSRRLGQSTRYVADPDGQLQNKLHLYTVPLYLVINPKGHIIKSSHSLLSAAEIINLLSTP